jgi:predicted amidophosphoribosyltransferase
MSLPRSSAEGLLTPLSAAGGLLSPRSGPGVCPVCFNLTASVSTPTPTRCRACLAGEIHLDVVVPISYSLSGSTLHRQIAAYKRDADRFVPDAIRALASILERFLSAHERCVGGGDLFDVVTTVPSSDHRRDERHPLRRIVAELVPAVGARHRRLLSPSSLEATPRAFGAGRYQMLHPLSGERVLVIDDMWTTGASAQSAAAALRVAGASAVAAVVIGRHLNRDYGDNELRLRRTEGSFDWSCCALCELPRSPAGGP